MTMSQSIKGDAILELDGGAYRIEAGPPLKRGKATDPAKDEDSLLHDSRTPEHYRLGGLDAKAQPIEEGKQFHYLDWVCERTFYLYRKRELSEDEQKERETTYSYVYEELGTFDSQEAAVDAAHTDAKE